MPDVSMIENAEDLEFFVELIEENMAAMIATTRSILTGGNSGYVDDAVQNACISIAHNIFSIKSRLECNKRRAFCVRVVRNKCIDIIRRNTRNACQSVEEIDYTLEADIPGPLDVVLVKEDMEAVISAINTLDENYSSVLKYKLIDGFTDAEIANILGITPQNVHVRFFRAKRKLRSLLSSE